MPNSFNVCTIHRLVEIFTHVWMADNEQVYLSSYATKEKACSICLKVAKESFTALWEKQHPRPPYPFNNRSFYQSSGFLFHTL